MTPRTDHSPADPAVHSPGATDRAQVSLNSGDGSGLVVTNAFTLPVSLHGLGAAGAAPAPFTIEVVPPPGANGVLPARGGPVQRVRDPAALVVALNAQAVKARIDFDHRSEPQSKTFSGSTAAEGWLGDYRLNSRGGIDADAELKLDCAPPTTATSRPRCSSPPTTTSSGCRASRSSTTPTCRSKPQGSIREPQ